MIKKQINSEKLKTPFPKSYWVIPGLLLAGEFPGAIKPEEAKDKIKKLYDCGICQFVNLMTPSETDHSGKPFIDYMPMVKEVSCEYDRPSFYSFSIRDLNVPSNETMSAILNIIDEKIEEGAPIYVHCWGGVGRTGTVIGCFLLRNGLATPNTVLDTIAELRRNDPKKHRTSPETQEQRKFVKNWLTVDKAKPINLSKSVGCLLGGAVGDALGAPVEFMKKDEILRRFGPDGITTYAPAYGGLGHITDDTQMTLFTAEGFLRGWVRGCHKGIASYTGMAANAYRRWLYTQGELPANYIKLENEEAGWLMRHSALHSQRAPGNTCISALKAMPDEGCPAGNDSKGCGGVMRMAPVGLFYSRINSPRSMQEAFEVGTEMAALTHGHPTGSLTGGVLAALIHELMKGVPLIDALASAKKILKQKKHHEETWFSIKLAEEYAKYGTPPDISIPKIGKGWVAEEALSISIFCALVAKDFRKGVVMAVNHDGDSDSTGAITGNLLGAYYGANAIPEEWLDKLELRDVITEIGSDLSVFRRWGIGAYSSKHDLNDYTWKKYPGY